MVGTTTGGTVVEAAVATLADHPDYRVLRRIATGAPDPALADAPGVSLLAVLDSEATSVDPSAAEVVELAVTVLAHDGRRVLGAVRSFHGLREPSGPLPDDVAAVTGLTDADLAGRSIDGDALLACLDGVSLVVAHKASYDRPVVERGVPGFPDLDWACSLEGVDWRARGHHGRSLPVLATGYGGFYAAHRAAADVEALCWVLAREGGEGVDARGTILEELLAGAAATEATVWALNSAFDDKDALKARGYRWSPGGDGRPKSWFRTLDERGLDAEVAFLAPMRGVRPAVTRRTARRRWSERA